ncbi:MAG: molybdopterin adenylyltransferase [Verrucomicrobia bacterium]|nr:molybdopterin adenylyltransferase [Verrucomicrobiota bacterium]
MKIGRITLSDRASAGVYEDQSGPEIERVVAAFFDEPIEWTRSLLPDDRDQIVTELSRLCDIEDCHLVITTGGTGPSARDVTPEATHRVLHKELPGFGEAMRTASFVKVKTAILSRATAGIRNRSLIVNLPGRPSAIQDCLQVLMPAIVECLDHICGFRPKIRS